MPRWMMVAGFGASLLAAFACNDETVELVEKDVCYTGMRWVGEKRGSPEMYPGRDCVGCHIDNDGPPLALGGTIYPFVLSQGSPGLAAQTGEDCFGVEGITITIEDGEGQVFELVTNRAGNFYIEGNPDDFAKPFSAVINWADADGPRVSEMNTAPSYGGCARCHDPAKPLDLLTIGDEAVPLDEQLFPTARIGLPGNGPGADGFETIEAELNALGCERDPSNPRCN